MARAQLAELRACGVNDDSCGFDLLTDAQKEIASMRVAIQVRTQPSLGGLAAVLQVSNDPTVHLLLQEVRTKTLAMLRQGLDAEDAA